MGMGGKSEQQLASDAAAAATHEEQEQGSRFAMKTALNGRGKGICGVRRMCFFSLSLFDPFAKKTAGRLPPPLPPSSFVVRGVEGGKRCCLDGSRGRNKKRFREFFARLKRREGIALSLSFFLWVGLKYKILALECGTPTRREDH